MDTKSVIAVIRALGFVGGMHYCPGCMNHFHDSRGQHEPGCQILESMMDDEYWWDDYINPPEASE